MIRRIVIGLALGTGLALLGGCAASGPERDLNDPTNSLVFGYIDMDDAPTDLEYANLRQVFPKGEEGYWFIRAEDGLFYNQYLPTGGYQVANFGGSDFWSGAHEYSFPDYGRNATAVRINVPGIYFVGAYRYEEVDTGFFEAGKFSMKPIETPNERELLQRIAEEDWVKGSAWEPRIRARLEELAK